MQRRRYTVNTPVRQRGLSTLVVILLIVLFLLLAGGGAAATLYLTGTIGAGEGSVTDPAAAVDGMEEAAMEPQAPAKYLPLEPALVVNFDRDGEVGYLQVSMDVMARDDAVLDAVKAHMPVVRNALVLMMSSKSYKQLDERSEKEALRTEARGEINAVLDERGAPGEIEAVYFTAFVMQ